MKNPFKYKERDIYFFTKDQNDKRFGSECKHNHVRNKRCLDCKRRVR